MKRFYFTLAAGVVFAGLLAAWAVWMRPGQSRQTMATTILSVKPDEVQAIAIEQDGKLAVEIRKGPEGWQIEKPRRVPTSSSAVESLLGALSPLEARRLIAESGADPAQFGLDPPRAVLALTMADGSVRRLLVGAETPVSRGVPTYYAKDEQGASVYTIDRFIAEQITGSWEAFRDRRVAAFRTDDVQRVRIQAGGVTVEARRNAETSVPERRWRLVSPYEAPGDTSAIEGVLRDLEFARISRFVNDEPSPVDLESYGLASPRAVIELTYSPSGESDAAGEEGAPESDTARAVALMVGGTTEDGAHYVKRRDQPFVFALPASDLETALEVSADRWVRRRVVGLARDEIQRISFGTSGRPGPFALERDEKGQWVIDPDGRRPEAKEVDSLLDALWRLEAQRVVAVGRSAEPPQRSGGGEATVIEITVAGHNGVPVTRLVIPIPLAVPAQNDGSQPPRTVYVEQGADRLAYEVEADELKGIESVIAQWTAPDQGAASSPSASR